MDLMYFLSARLRFIETLWRSSVAPFQETKRKIEAGESPFVDTRRPEDYDEPAFLAQWQEADESILVIGHWCFCMVQASLQAFLRDCIGPLGSLWWSHEELRASLGTKKAASWFERYRLLFLEDLGIDWNQGPVPLSKLEQLNLTRNDLIHNVDTFTMAVERSDGHSEKFPTGLFVDEMWFGLSKDRIRIDKDKLQLASNLVLEFCGWLDRFRCDPHAWAR